MRPSTSFATLPGRITLQYAESGDPAGVPVIFLHGYTDSGRSFEPVLPHLPRSIRALCPTLRGHGESDRPAGGYAMRDFADDIAAFMDALGVDRAVIAGHSMSSVIAQRFAIDHPDRTLGLVLLGAFFSAPANPGVRELWDTAICRIADPVDRAFALEFQRGTMVRPIPPGFLEMVTGESMKVPARVWRAALEGMLQGEQSGDLARIRTPVLILWGDQDNFIPRHEQDAMMSVIVGAQLIVYDGAGHGVHWDEPAGVARDLAVFVAALPKRAAPARSLKRAS